MPGSEGGITGFTRKVIGVRKFWQRGPAAPEDLKAATGEEPTSAQFNPKELTVDKPVIWKSETAADSHAAPGAITGGREEPEGDTRFGGKYSVTGSAHRYSESGQQSMPGDSLGSAGADSSPGHELGHVSQQGPAAARSPDESASQIPVTGSKTGMTDDSEEAGHSIGMRHEHVRPESGAESPADMRAAGAWSHLWQGANSGERGGADAYIGRNDGTVQPSQSDSAPPAAWASDAAPPQDEAGGLQGAQVPPGEGAQGSASPGFHGGVRVASGDLDGSPGGDADLRVRVGAEPGSAGGSNATDLQDSSGAPEAGRDAATPELAGNEGSGEQSADGITHTQNFQKTGDGASTAWRPNPQRVNGDIHPLGPDTEPEQGPVSEGTDLTGRGESSAAINRTGDRSFFVDETGVIRGEPPSAATEDLAAPEPHGADHLMPSTLADLSVDHIDVPDAPDAPDLDGVAELDHHDLASKAHDLLDR